MYFKDLEDFEKFRLFEDGEICKKIPNMTVSGVFLCNMRDSNNNLGCCSSNTEVFLVKKRRTSTKKQNLLRHKGYTWNSETKYWVDGKGSLLSLSFVMSKSIMELFEAISQVEDVRKGIKI